MTTEDQKCTNGSVKPADDPLKYSSNAAQIVQCIIDFVGVRIHNAKMSFTKQGTSWFFIDSL